MVMCATGKAFMACVTAANDAGDADFGYRRECVGIVLDTFASIYNEATSMGTRAFTTTLEGESMSLVVPPVDVLQKREVMRYPSYTDELRDKVQEAFDALADTVFDCVSWEMLDICWIQNPRESVIKKLLIVEWRVRISLAPLPKPARVHIAPP